MNNFVVATIKPWNIDAFHQYMPTLPGQWHLITSPNELTLGVLKNINPRYIFFPHWSWVVPKELLDNYECVCFHMTDVPYGRGGSPLQNLIVRGHSKTKLSALKMVSELDAGPVYGKMDLSLEGRAQDIYSHVATQVYDLIKTIISEDIVPAEQKGEVTLFQRRTQVQSLLPETGTLSNIFDYVRMLDAESYPHAFIEYGDFRIEFTNANIRKGNLNCEVSIKKVK
jgi:methionyl-tRNA formyltransferase